MTPSQVRDRIRELEQKFLRIRNAFHQVANGREGAPLQRGEAAASVEAGEIREDLTGDR